MDLERRISMYGAFVRALESFEGGSLSPEHIEQLKRKRGLDEDTVRAARIATGTKERVTRAIIHLQKEGYSDPELQQAGLLYGDKPAYRWFESRKFPEPKLIIPYLSDQQNRVIYLRAHKQGPPGIDLEIYGQHILCHKPKRIVITEAEFKALALIQSGIPALGIPGISSFAGKHFDRLLSLLLLHRVEEVVILFDNEIKYDSRYPNYKPDPMKRWDTEYYALAMARRLYKDSDDAIRSATIARLPDAWRIDGKIDPDGALAAGKTPQELLQCVEKAVIPDDYFASLPEEARIVIAYKLEQLKLHASPLKEYKGQYYWVIKGKKEGGEGKDQWQRISNFVLHPARKVRRADRKLERIYQATNKQGEVAEISFSAADMTKVAAFKEVVFDAGGYVWSGSGEQHTELLLRLEVSASPRVAEESNVFGRCEERGYWVFGDGLLSESSSRAFPLGEDGVVWNNSLFGVIPLRDKEAPVPMLATIEANDVKLSQVYEVWKANIGSPAVGLALGWVLACTYSDTVFEEYGFFPLLGIFGKGKSGKTVFGRWVTRAWGIPPHSQNPLMLDQKLTSLVGLSRTMAKRSSLPVWCDEFRNDGGDKFFGYIRSVYNRSSGVKGAFSNDNRTTGAQTKACLIVSGEEYPNDFATMSRFVVVQLSEDRRDPTYYEQARELSRQLPWLVKRLILERERYKESFMGLVQLIFAQLNKQVTVDDDRMILGYAIPLAAFSCLLVAWEGETQKNRALFEELRNWAARDIQRLSTDLTEDDHVTSFFKMVNILMHRYSTGGRSVVNRLHLGLSQDGLKLYVWYSGVYHEVLQATRTATGKAPFDKRTIRGYLREAAYMEPKTTPRKLGGRGQSSKDCLVLHLNHAHTPPILREIAEKIAQTDWDEQAATYYEADEPDATDSSQSISYPEEELEESGTLFDAR